MNHKAKNPAYKHFLHIIPRYDKNAKNDPANVKPGKIRPRESEENLDKTLREIKAALEPRTRRGTVSRLHNC